MPSGIGYGATAKKMKKAGLIMQGAMKQVERGMAPNNVMRGIMKKGAMLGVLPKGARTLELRHDIPMPQKKKLPGRPGMEYKKILLGRKK